MLGPEFANVLVSVQGVQHQLLVITPDAVDLIALQPLEHSSRVRPPIDQVSEHQEPVPALRGVIHHLQEALKGRALAMHIAHDQIAPALVACKVEHRRSVDLGRWQTVIVPTQWLQLRPLVRFVFGFSLKHRFLSRLRGVGDQSCVLSRIGRSQITKFRAKQSPVIRVPHILQTEFPFRPSNGVNPSRPPSSSISTSRVAP